ncbi:MAG: TonB-dependent receptor domain-containing protein [bacterium]
MKKTLLALFISELFLFLFSFNAVYVYGKTSLKKIKFKAKIKKGVKISVTPTDKFYADIFGGYGAFDTKKYGLDLNTGRLQNNIMLYIKAIGNNSNGWIQNTAENNLNYYAALMKYYNGNKSNITFIYGRNDGMGYMPQIFSKSLENIYGYQFNFPMDTAYIYNTEHRWHAAFRWINYINKNITFENKVSYSYSRYYRVSYANPDFQSNPLSLLNGGYLPNSPVNYAAPTMQNSYNPTAEFGSSLLGTAYHNFINNVDKIGDAPMFILKLPFNKLKLGGDFLSYSTRSAEFWYGSYNMPEGDKYNDVWDEYDAISNYYVYAQDKIKIIPKKLLIEPAMKYQTIKTVANYNSGYYNAIGGTSSKFYNYWQPSILAIYFPIKDINIYAVWGKTVGVPQIGSKYISINSETDEVAENYDPLMDEKPQYMTDYTLGVKYLHKGFLLSAYIYREDYINKRNFVYNPIVGASVYFSSGSARQEGFKLSAKYNFNKIYGIFAKYSYKNAQFTSNFSGTYGTVSAGQHVPYIPKNLAGFGGFAKIFGTYLKIFGAYTGTQYVPVSAQKNGVYYNINQNYEIGGYFILNGYASRNFNLSKISLFNKMNLKIVKLSLSIANILNRQYNFWSDYTYGVSSTNPVQEVMPGMPRFVYVRASFKF